MKKQITWKTVEVEVSKIKPTPNNFKLKTEDGSLRFATSVDNYGLAGSVIINLDYTLIDGNTRLQKAKELKMKKVFASMPSRKLTPKEFVEFAAMYDMARAGEVDIKRIKEELGTTKGFFEKWGVEIPKAALAKLEEFEKQEKKIVGNKSVIPKGVVPATRQLTLVYTNDEAEKIISLAESLYEKLKVDNLSDAVMKLFVDAKKFYKK